MYYHYYQLIVIRYKKYTYNMLIIIIHLLPMMNIIITINSCIGFIINLKKTFFFIFLSWNKRLRLTMSSSSVRLSITQSLIQYLLVVESTGRQECYLIPFCSTNSKCALRQQHLNWLPRLRQRLQRRNKEKCCAAGVCDVMQPIFPYLYNIAPRWPQLRL